ncbi:hypothetical protein MRX96_010728 [Rhipicephalus microplus]
MRVMPVPHPVPDPSEELRQSVHDRRHLERLRGVLHWQGNAAGHSARDSASHPEISISLFQEVPRPTLSLSITTGVMSGASGSQKDDGTNPTDESAADLSGYEAPHAQTLAYHNNEYAHNCQPHPYGA